MNEYFCDKSLMKKAFQEIWNPAAALCEWIVHESKPCISTEKAAVCSIKQNSIQLIIKRLETLEYSAL